MKKTMHRLTEWRNERSMYKHRFWWGINYSALHTSTRKSEAEISADFMICLFHNLILYLLSSSSFFGWRRFICSICYRFWFFIRECSGENSGLQRNIPRTKFGHYCNNCHWSVGNLRWFGITDWFLCQLAR